MKFIIFILMTLPMLVFADSKDFTIYEKGQWDSKSKQCKLLQTYHDAVVQLRQICILKFGTDVIGTSLIRFNPTSADQNGDCFAVLSGNCTH